MGITDVTLNRSIQFFDDQFNRQVESGDFHLNPFEVRALEHIKGTVLDLGCGLGNLALAAARRGHRVTAVDASAAAIAHIERTTLAERLPVHAQLTEAADWKFERNYTTVVSVGLLMFLPRDRALHLLRGIQDHVEPGGRAIINVLTDGTTFMDMFQPDGYCLFGRDELENSFSGWETLLALHDSFPAARNTRKEFATLIAGKPTR